LLKKNVVQAAGVDRAAPDLAILFSNRQPAVDLAERAGRPNIPGVTVAAGASGKCAPGAKGSTIASEDRLAL